MIQSLGAGRVDARTFEDLGRKPGQPRPGNAPEFSDGRRGVFRRSMDMVWNHALESSWRVIMNLMKKTYGLICFGVFPGRSI